MAPKEDVGTAAEQNRCGTGLRLCHYFWVTDPFEKLTEALASKSEKMRCTHSGASASGGADAVAGQPRQMPEQKAGGRPVGDR